MLEHLWALSYDSKTIDILRNSKYGIPLIQSVHLLGLTMLLGVVVLLNLRLLGVGMKSFTLPELSSQMWRWSKLGLVLMVVTGFFIFLPDPARYAASPSFRVKMVLLIVAITYQFTIFRSAVRRNPEESSHGRNVIIAVLSLLLWFGVGSAGRAIAFVG